MNTNEQIQLAKKMTTDHAIDHAMAAEAVSYSYEEMGRSFQSEKDVLFQFRANLNQLEDLSTRLTFVLGEVSQTLKKR